VSVKQEACVLMLFCSYAALEHEKVLMVFPAAITAHDSKGQTLDFLEVAANQV